MFSRCHNLPLQYTHRISFLLIGVYLDLSQGFFLLKVQPLQISSFVCSVSQLFQPTCFNPCFNCSTDLFYCFILHSFWFFLIQMHNEMCRIHQSHDAIQVPWIFWGVERGKPNLQTRNDINVPNTTRFKVLIGWGALSIIYQPLTSKLSTKSFGLILLNGAVTWHYSHLAKTIGDSWWQLLSKHPLKA